MLAHHFELALISFGRNKYLTALMIVTIALGIGASMTALTVFHVLSSDPLPGKSQSLFYVLVDPQTMEGYYNGIEPPAQLTRFDAEELYRAKRADHQTMMYGGVVAVQSLSGKQNSFMAAARFTTTDFFPMFETPFLYGDYWGHDADNELKQVTVIGKSLNDRVFGGENSVGRTLRLNGRDFTIVGVLNHWRPAPKFYDLFVGKRSFGEAEEVFLPFSTAASLQLETGGLINCYDQTSPGMRLYDITAPCVWVQFWAQLNTPERMQEYRVFLEGYSTQQRAIGRFQRPPNIRLRTLREYLDFNKVIPENVHLQLWIAFAFLIVCLINMGALLLATFLNRTSEIGTRRALGATRGEIFAQHLVEAATIGFAGGVLGLGLTWLGLWVVRQQPVQYADLVTLDGTMLLTVFVMAIASALIAGMLPAWRACMAPSVLQITTQ